MCTICMFERFIKMMLQFRQAEAAWGTEAVWGTKGNVTYSSFMIKLITDVES